MVGLRRRENEIENERHFSKNQLNSQLLRKNEFKITILENIFFLYDLHRRYTLGNNS
jgi:hypothetical protein